MHVFVDESERNYYLVCAVLVSPVSDAGFNARLYIATGDLVVARDACVRQLGLPDAIAWAYGAGGDWRRRVEPLVQQVTKLD